MSEHPPTEGGSADPEICAHWDWCPYCRNGLDTGLECDQCGADLMPVQKALEELQRIRSSGGASAELGPKMGTEAELNCAAQDAYLELLLTMRPERRRTVSGQRILAQLVQAIARSTEQDTEAVQNHFEGRVCEIQGEPKLVLSSPEPSEIPRRMRGYLAEYATLQERIAAKLETPDDIWGGLLNAEMAEDIRAYLAGVSPEPGVARDAARWAFAVHNGMPVRNQTAHAENFRWVANVGHETFFGDGPGSAIDNAIAAYSPTKGEKHGT